jgi:hypothetical protein
MNKAVCCDFFKNLTKDNPQLVEILCQNMQNETINKILKWCKSWSESLQT